jgi:hypothetical protein
MLQSLDLVGDGDELEIVLAVEDAFAIKFTNDQLEYCLTAGDLNGAVWAHMSGRAGADNLRCMNAMAFNTLRRALVANGAPRNIRPADRLEGFGMRPRELSRALRQETGLALGFGLGTVGNAGAIALLAGAACVLLGIVWHWLFAAAVLLFAAFAILVRLDSGSYEGCETVAEAAARIAASNFGALAAGGGRFDAASVWQTLRETLAAYCDVHAEEIGPDTRLIQALPAKIRV